LCLTVPNIGYFPLRFYHLKTGEVSDFHGNGMIMNEHIRYYCVRSITKLMRLTGFGNINIQGAMKTIISTSTGKAYEKTERKLRKNLLAVRPTPLNILSKINRLIRLWSVKPSLFAAGLVIEARKVEESKYKYNVAIDHQLRTGEQEKLNVNYIR